MSPIFFQSLLRNSSSQFHNTTDTLFVMTSVFCKSILHQQQLQCYSQSQQLLKKIFHISLINDSQIFLHNDSVKKGTQNMFFLTILYNEVTHAVTKAQTFTQNRQTCSFPTHAVTCPLLIQPDTVQSLKILMSEGNNVITKKKNYFEIWNRKQ